jgi:sugar fermentation stimulation protein A
MIYKFQKPLIEGVISSRPNRFLMNVDINNKTNLCHCPSTGRIGNIIFKDIPCLLSKSENKLRKTKYTVEAISLDLIYQDFKLPIIEDLAWYFNTHMKDKLEII